MVHQRVELLVREFSPREAAASRGFLFSQRSAAPASVRVVLSRSVLSVWVIALCVGAASCKSEDARDAPVANSMFDEQAYQSYERRDYSVVVFLADTLRGDRLGCNGFSRPASADIDRFSRRAMSFENCLAGANWTKPSTASILTGLYPSSHRATKRTSALANATDTLAEILHLRGYATGAFVANGWIFDATAGFRQGFETFVKFLPDESTRRSKPAGEDVVDSCLEWLASIDRAEPFFAYVHVVDPHGPYLPPAGYRERFVTRQRSLDGDGPTIDGDFAREDDARLSSIDEDDRKLLEDLYVGEVAYTSAAFGKLLRGLEERGVREETMILFVSDHGEEFREHDGWRHNPHLYREVIRVPLLVSFPRLTRLEGKHYPAPVGHVDLLPTVLDVIGMDAPDELDGQSLLELALANEDLDTRPLFAESNEDGIRRTAVLESGMKYIRQTSPNEVEYLFDVAGDPGERVNLAESRPDVVEALRQRVETFAEVTYFVKHGTFACYRNDSAEARQIAVTVRSEREFAWAFDLDDEARVGDAGDNPRSRVDLMRAGQHVARFTATVEPGGTAGMCFEVSNSTGKIRMRFEVDGELASRSSVRLGPLAAALESNPWDLEVADLAALAIGVPEKAAALLESGGFTLYQVPPPATTVLDAATAQALRDLGYVIDDPQERDDAGGAGSAEGSAGGDGRER